MSALIGLVGALIGGVLVLLGEELRQRASRRRELVVRLVDASTAYALLLARHLAEARDAFDQGRPLTAKRPERYEANVRFFLTAGMEELYPAARDLAKAYFAYTDAGSTPEHRSAASDAYFEVARRFEQAVRAIQQRGSICDEGTISSVRISR